MSYNQDPTQSHSATGASHPTGFSEPAPINGQYPSSAQATTEATAPTTAPNGSAQPSAGGFEVVCGPLINYRHMSNELSDNPIWHGSVLIVAKNPAQTDPEMHLKCTGTLDFQAQALPAQERSFRGEKIYQDPGKTFYRFRMDVPIQDLEAHWEYTIPAASSIPPKVFTVPSKTQSMRIMFHSCNGFSVGTDEDAWSGPALWNDVLRTHVAKPFHVMIGGGDQIYNDNVRVSGPLKEWTNVSNPHKRREFQFGAKLRADCDEHYYQNYIRWYGIDPFKMANSVIPQVNIWDDHDIIDGFGSYTDRFMKCHVFRGIGSVALKYYLLFQHHIPPPKNMFCSDQDVQNAPLEEGSPNLRQMKDTWTSIDSEKEDPSYILGHKPGPYVEEHSRSIFCQLGQRIGFLGIDARMERTRHQINYNETYDALFQRLDREYSRNSNLKHLILLLGVPIAYPRLIWLENILTSPLIAPIRLLNKRFGWAGGLFNKFDGQVDLLDDLDDHYTARSHKHERREFLQRLQAFSKKFSARVTILGGDVHLAAVGRFYSKPAFSIPAERDWRYMVNVISSAITNKPPPPTVANLLARRNKIHHMDRTTDETLLEFFDHDPGRPKELEHSSTNGGLPAKKTKDFNHVTMPSRNYAVISESQPAMVATRAATEADMSASRISEHPATTGGSTNMRKPIHDGEKNAGTRHPAADGVEQSGMGGPFGLDVTIKVEISNKDREGKTEGYAFTIPGLDCSAYADEGAKW